MMSEKTTERILQPRLYGRLFLILYIVNINYSMPRDNAVPVHGPSTVRIGLPPEHPENLTIPYSHSNFLLDVYIKCYHNSTHTKQVLLRLKEKFILEAKQICAISISMTISYYLGSGQGLSI
jgi:hypothetical protein